MTATPCTCRPCRATRPMPPPAPWPTTPGVHTMVRITTGETVTALRSTSVIHAWAWLSPHGRLMLAQDAEAREYLRVPS